MTVYTRDGELIGQFGEQKRSPLRFEEIPEDFVNALLAAEDDGFFEHRGIDVMGLLRAVSELVLTGEKGSGGSTLTMQVARNYFLSLERTFTRKFNEILLAIEIERRLEKHEIFELYVNRVFLGHRAYGFEAAAQVYYGRSLAELELPQLAMLAGIPKAPSRNNPISGPEAGQERRNWILGRMASLGYIDDATRAAATAVPVIATHHGARITFSAPYAAEMVRQEMLNRYGLAAYTDGFRVITTIDSKLQRAARDAVMGGLQTYDQRHGYRGAEQYFAADEQLDDTAQRQRWGEQLAAVPEIAGLLPAIVTGLREADAGAAGSDAATETDGDTLPAAALVLLPDGSEAELLWDNGLRQARRYLTENSRGGPPQTVADVLRPGDLVRLRSNEDGQWQLSQVPAAQAALVSLNPDDGALLAVVGGMGFELSKFNRATQAERQPGSSFKPFIYSAGLDAGMTAATIINDAPIVLQDRALEDVWRPENDGGTFDGPTRLRMALTRSRNLVSIRLLQQVGIPQAITYLESLGFDTSGFSPNLSLALGSPVLTPMDMAAAYAMLANGGHRIAPHLISSIEDSSGLAVYTANPARVCRDCAPPPAATADDVELSMEQILARAEQPRTTAPLVMDPRINFIVDSMMQDVIKRGTGRRALVLERGDLAGKTGTTNGPMDAWFSGYNRDVVTTTWVGFDNYTPLGRREFGGTAALPIWIDYMRMALADSPDVPRAMPPGIVTVRIDPQTGLPAGAGQRDAIFEYFREEKVPQGTADDANGSSATEEDDLLQDIF